MAKYAVRHYLKDHKTLCGTEQKKMSLILTDIEKDVTCKKCLKRLNTYTKESGYTLRKA